MLRSYKINITILQKKYRIPFFFINRLNVGKISKYTLKICAYRKIFKVQYFPLRSRFNFNFIFYLQFDISTYIFCIKDPF